MEETLSARMQEFGFNIVNTLVQDISPDGRVRDSMNSINAAQRDRVAAQSLAEADKIKRVTQAEAEAESKRLQGEGVAAQRKAIAQGIAEQYEMLRKVGIEGTAEQLLLMTQYFDTMQDVARNGRSNVLFLPSNPSAVGSMGEEIRSALLQAQVAGDAYEAGGSETVGPADDSYSGHTPQGYTPASSANRAPVHPDATQKRVMSEADRARKAALEHARRLRDQARGNH